jgi:hypothetical protein
MVLSIVGEHCDGQDWQLDVISGRHSWIVHVDHRVYEPYQVGNNYDGRRRGCVPALGRGEDR